MARKYVGTTATEQLIIGCAVSWAMLVRKGAPRALIRSIEDMLLDAVEAWQKEGMAALARHAHVKPVPRKRKRSTPRKGTGSR